MDNDNITILDLPDIVFEKILSFLTYDEIAKNRLVCKRFDTICKSLLNRGFVMVEKRQSLVSRSIKHCLPRRESERRAHPLARHCEILSALETRISMLSMTFTKFIETGLCCFIPGKIIDEILHILKVVQETSCPPRTHDLLQELRDISSMAMEHFEEHIVPSLRVADVNHSSIKQNIFQSTGFTRTGRPINVSDIIRKEFKAIHQNTKIYRQQLGGMKKLIMKLNTKVRNQDSCLTYQAAKLREQRRLIRDQATTITEMKKRLDEWNRKFTDLATEVTKAREKQTDNKASQTNETDSTSASAAILKDLNITMPSVFSECRTEEVHHNTSPKISLSIFDELKVYSKTNDFKNIFSNTVKSTNDNYPLKSPNLNEYLKSINLRNRRTTISDFRTDIEKEKLNNDPLIIDRQQTIESNDINSRKRKVIDIIQNIANSKVPKKTTTANTVAMNNEIKRVIAKFSHKKLHYSSDEDFTNVPKILERLRARKRVLRNSDIFDEIPTKVRVATRDR